MPGIKKNLKGKKMIRKILIFLIPVMLVIIYGFKPHDEPNNGNHNPNGPYRILTNPNQVAAVDSKQLDANQINTWFRTNGSFNRDPSTGNAGFEWPKGSGKTARYASGLWLGCVVGIDTLTAVAEFSYDYLPGYVDGNGNPQGQDDPNYHIYKIVEGNTTDPDYVNWPFSQGAYADSTGKPLLLGTQTMFYVYTDGYPHSSGSTSLASLKAQILQTNWAYNVNGTLGNIIFQEYRVINRSNNTWTKTYLGQWTDDDLGEATDDKVGCDTNLSLGFTYNADNSDGIYGSAPPAVGFDFFRGAVVQTGNQNDSVYYYYPPGTNNYFVKRGYKDLGLTVFNYYNNGSPQPSDPLNNTETYRVLEGKWRTGESWVDPNTGDTSKKCFNGDPVAGTGWLNPGSTDRRFIQCTGPFTMAPGDTQTITVAQIIARSSSNIESVRALKTADDLAQKIFNNNFQVPPSAPIVPTSIYTPGNGKIYISWSDTAEKISLPNKISGGTYKFQGYNLYQIKAGTNGQNATDRVLMATFDRKDGVTDIQDSVFNNDYGTWIYYVVQKGYDNGISRYFVMDRDYVDNTFISSGTEYPIVVTAYYYDSLAGAARFSKVNETPITSSNIIKVIPQNLTLGTVVNYGVGDTISNSQRDLGAMPIVVDPIKLISASYTSTYGGTNSNPNWSLTRNYNGSTTILYQNIPEFTGLQDTAKTVDGFLVVHQPIKDSGVVKDPGDPIYVANNWPTYSNKKAWTYYPQGMEWFTGPDTSAVKLIGNGGAKPFDSRSLGFGFPTTGSFRNTKTRIFANGSQFNSISATNTILTGGPLRKIKIVFGKPSFAFRFLPDTINANSTPYKDTVQIPFSVFDADELDSSTTLGPRQLNVGFVDSNRNGQWDPNTSALGGSHFTYIFASNYDVSNRNYVNKNPGTGSPTIGLGSLDLMYIWLPRIKAVNGVPLTWSNGDTLTVTPYRITRPEFVPGLPVKYSWTVNGTSIANPTAAKDELSQIKAFPNPYYGGSRLETDPFNRFIYISHLPSVCKIFVYTLDGVLVKSIDRNNTNPNNSLEKWDLKNANDIPVASGMYIIFVDAGSIGVKTIKVAIFTPEERIDTF